MPLISIDDILNGLDLCAPFESHGLCAGFDRVIEDSRKILSLKDLLFIVPGKKYSAETLLEKVFATHPHQTIVVQGPQRPRPGLMQVRDQKKALHHIYSLFYPQIPSTCVAVTGTDGKTSVSQLLVQLWRAAKINATAVGTLGFGLQGEEGSFSLTTPERPDLYGFLHACGQKGVTHVALEASSQALDQDRLWPLSCQMGIITNLFHDHLDYHKTKQAYGQAKLKLFLHHVQKYAVISQSLEKNLSWLGHLHQARPDLHICTYGPTAENRFMILEHNQEGQKIRFEGFFGTFDAWTGLMGYFQAENILAALCAFFLLNPSQDCQATARFIENLQPVRGRMEHVATFRQAKIYIDYAHTPHALACALNHMRAHSLKRVLVLFGAGGNRDTAKRPLMGKIAQRAADLVILTDDNPRYEDANLIRKAIKEGCPGAIEIPDRQHAIAYAIGLLEPGDVLLVAGKGHETGQDMGDTIFPFCDRHSITKACASL